MLASVGIEAGCNYSCTFCGAFSSRRPADSRRASSGGHMPGPVVARLIDSARVLGIGGTPAFAEGCDLHLAGPDLPETVEPIASIVPAQVMIEQM